MNCLQLCGQGLTLISHPKIHTEHGESSSLSHLWGNWRHTPSFPSRSRVHAGHPPKAGLPSCTATQGSCSATRKPLETVPLLKTIKQYRRPLRGSPWALRFHPPPHECTTLTWLWVWAWAQIESAAKAQVTSRHFDSARDLVALIRAQVYFC